MQILNKNICYLFSPCAVKLAIHFSCCTDWICSPMQTLFTAVFTYVFIYIYTQTFTHTLTHPHITGAAVANSVYCTSHTCNIVKSALFFHNNCNNTYRIGCYSSVWVLGSSLSVNNDSEKVTYISECCTRVNKYFQWNLVKTSLLTFFQHSWTNLIPKLSQITEHIYVVSLICFPLKDNSC